jgi:hypothetical protein
MMTIDLSLISSIAASVFAAGAMLLSFTALRSSKRWQARCTELEAGLASVRREMELVASISARRPTQSIDQAIDSARRGGDPVKLTQHFGLSRGEADLVMRLHGRRGSAHLE